MFFASLTNFFFLLHMKILLLLPMHPKGAQLFLKTLSCFILFSLLVGVWPPTGAAPWWLSRILLLTMLTSRDTGRGVSYAYRELRHSVRRNLLK